MYIHNADQQKTTWANSEGEGVKGEAKCNNNNKIELHAFLQTRIIKIANKCVQSIQCVVTVSMLYGICHIGSKSNMSHAWHIFTHCKLNDAKIELHSLAARNPFPFYLEKCIKCNLIMPLSNVPFPFEMITLLHSLLSINPFDLNSLSFSLLQFEYSFQWNFNFNAYVKCNVEYSIPKGVYIAQHSKSWQH